MSQDRRSYVYVYEKDGKPIYVGKGTAPHLDREKDLSYYKRALALSSHAHVQTNLKTTEGVSFYVVADLLTEDEARATEAILIKGLKHYFQLHNQKHPSVNRTLAHVSKVPAASEYLIDRYSLTVPLVEEDVARLVKKGSVLRQRLLGAVKEARQECSTSLEDYLDHDLPVGLGKPMILRKYLRRCEWREYDGYTPLMNSDAPWYFFRCLLRQRYFSVRLRSIIIRQGKKLPVSYFRYLQVIGLLKPIEDERHIYCPNSWYLATLYYAALYFIRKDIKYLERAVKEIGPLYSKSALQYAKNWAETEAEYEGYRDKVGERLFRMLNALLLKVMKATQPNRYEDRLRRLARSRAARYHKRNPEINLLRVKIHQTRKLLREDPEHKFTHKRKQRLKLFKSRLTAILEE